MKSNVVVSRIAEGLYSELQSKVQERVEVKKGYVDAMLASDDEEVILKNALDIAYSIEAAIVATKVEDEVYPKFLANLVVKEKNRIALNVRTKLKSEFKYSSSTDIVVDSGFVTSLGKAYNDILFDMYLLQNATANAKELSTTINDIAKVAELPFDIAFAVDITSSAMVLEITDSKVVFNVSIDNALKAGNLALFKDADEYDIIARNHYINVIGEDLKGIQTPVQLIKSKAGFLKDILGGTTKKRASKIIRGSYHRQAKYLDKVKSGIGYYDETVKINGEDVDVFALVRKDANNDISVVLTPFDIKTLDNVDFDVVGAVKALLAG